ncbi:MAG: DEAD/DEAH box helicase, partial [Verrucomicrobiota bacterium]
MELEGLSIHLQLPDLWQADAIRALKAERDVVVDAPTGAGKTYVFEQFIKAKAIQGQAVYTVPTRALANDKWREWQADGWDVGIATGDIAIDVDAPVVVATLETQRERLLRGESPDLLVIDEYQMIGDARRGLNYELSAVLAPSSCRLLLLSGSVANPSDIANWLERLGRDVELIQTTDRPVPLDDIPMAAMPYRAPNQVKGFWQRLAIQALMADYAPLLIFAPQRRAAEKIAQKISEALPQATPVELSQEQQNALGPKLTKMVRNRVAYHHSGLSYAQRAGVIEPLAKAGQLRVIVATTGLAAGINFSVRSVLVSETRYRQGPFEQEIEPDELLQMFGRAGRRGLDEVGYVLSSDSSPRLSDARAKQLHRTNRIDWPTLLRIMKRAGDQGESPFDAATDLCAKLFSKQTITLGFEDRALPEDESSDRGDGKLFGLGPVRREVWNSQSDWEREDPAAAGEAALKEALVFNSKKKRWAPALQTGWFMQDRVRSLGRLCKLEKSGYGAEIAVGNVVEEDRVRLTKRWRSLTKLPKKQGEKARDELVEFILPILKEQEPGVAIERVVDRQGAISAHLDLGEVETQAYRDTHGNWLVDPKRRTVELEFETGYVDEETGSMHEPAAGTAAHAWRTLGLIEPDGMPTARGEIFSFFQKGEGLAIAAALEDETYPIDELVIHLANIRAGHRFERVAEGGSGRLALVCRQTFGPVDYPGYLRLGLPVGYGDGAAEVIELRLAGEAIKQHDPDNELGEGDVERAQVEWLSLLRHIRHAPDVDHDRWMELKSAAAERLVGFDQKRG